MYLVLLGEEIFLVAPLVALPLVGQKVCNMKSHIALCPDHSLSMHKDEGRHDVKSWKGYEG